MSELTCEQRGVGTPLQQASRVMQATTTPEGTSTNTYNDEGARLSEAYAPAGGYPASARSTSYAFDFAGRLQTETAINGALSQPVTYAYDRAGNRTAIRWPDAWTARYVWDRFGRLREVWADPDGAAPCASALDACGDAMSGSGDEFLLAVFTYDRVGRLLRREHGGGTGAGAVSRIDWAYEPDSDIAQMRHQFNGETIVFGYAYDAAGRLTGEAASDPSWLWSASSAGTQSYAAANTVDQYGSVAGETLTWDANANLSGWGARSFSYDSENRMRTANVGGVATAYEYDPSGRRVMRNVAGTVTRFLSAGAEEIGDYDAAGVLARRYVPGAGTDNAVAFITSVGARTYPHANRIGSVIALANGAGARVQLYIYDPYGNEVGGTSSDSNTWRYTGRRFDVKTGALSLSCSDVFRRSGTVYASRPDRLCR